MQSFAHTAEIVSGFECLVLLIIDGRLDPSFCDIWQRCQNLSGEKTVLMQHR